LTFLELKKEDVIIWIWYLVDYSQDIPVITLLKDHGCP
jgi:hypothetical protein